MLLVPEGDVVGSSHHEEVGVRRSRIKVFDASFMNWAIVGRNKSVWRFSLRRYHASVVLHMNLFLSILAAGNYLCYWRFTLDFCGISSNTKSLELLIIKRLKSFATILRKLRVQNLNKIKTHFLIASSLYYGLLSNFVEKICVIRICFVNTNISVVIVVVVSKGSDKVQLMIIHMVTKNERMKKQC